MSVDPWEITRRRAMDYSSMLEHTSKMLQHNFPSIDIRVFYLCKSNAIPLISPQVLREGNYGCICVTRPQESEQLRKSLGARWNSLIYIADDTAILDAAMDKISAKNVRDRLKEGKSIVPLVGQKMAEYFADHRIREKMIGEEEWDDEEKRMVKINSRNPAPLLSPDKEGHEDAAGPDNNTGSAKSSPSSPMREAQQPHSPWKAAQLSKPPGGGGGSGSKEGVGEHEATSISDTWDENASSGSPRVSPRDKPPTMPVLPEVSMHVSYSNMAGGGDAEML
jgi:hypothetical protein